ncbi:MAG: TonB-dependent receptor [Acidobacteriota bacterium]
MSQVRRILQFPFRFQFPRKALSGFTRLLLACLVLLVAGLNLPTAFSQAVYGTIFGTVTDPTGAVIPNATVTVTDISKNVSVTVHTNGSGEYRVQNLIPDNYRVEATAQGFNQGTVQSVQVFADTQPKVDVELTAGATTNVVHVTSAAPLLNTSRADVSMILNSRALENLPNLNRNFTSFELLTPGTSYIGWSVGQDQNPQQSQQIEVNGQLPFATGYELDGTDNQDPIIGVAVINPNLDAVSEMKVTSQNYDAELGGSVAGMVTAQTKSGTNSFHGSAFEFRRTDAQQARDPFAQAQRDPLTGRYISPNEQNMFGGSLGGPVRKDKIFFFGDYQGVRQKTGSAVKTTVPTALAHSTCTSGGSCDLSDYLNPALGGSPQYQVYDPTTGIPDSPAGRTPFAGNMIPATELSAPAINLMKDMPLPNTGNGSIVNNYIASGSGIFNNNQFDVRGDMQMSQKFHSFGRYTRFNSTLSGAPYFGAAGGLGFGAGGFAGTDSVVDQNVAAGGNYVVSPSWVTDFRFGWFRIHINEQGPDYNQPLGNQLGIPNANVGDLSLNGGLPQFNIDILSNGSNGSSNLEFGTSAAQFLQTENVFQVNDNWTHQMGNHTIRFGTDLRYAMNHLVGLDNNNVRSGNFHFAAPRTAGTDANGVATAGLGFGTFVLGDVTAFQRTQTQNTNAQERQKRAFFYAQDQWRATNTLTVNYGLRWDMYFPETVNGKGQGGLLDLNTGNIRIAGYGPWGTNLNVGKNWTEFAPRIGLAWQVRRNTVLRAGYGRAYGMGWSGDIFGEVLTFSYPTQVSQNLNSATSYAQLFNLSDGPPGYTFDPIPPSGNYPLPDGVGVPTRPLTMRNPTIDAWNLAMQQQLTATTSLQISYIGSHGIHNMFDSSNQASPNQPTIRGFNNCNGIVAGCPTADINPLTGLPYTLNDRRPYYNGTAQQSLHLGYGHPFGWTQDLRYNANQATTRYNALQVVFDKSYSHGLQMMAHYTWSKAQAHESDYYFNDPRADYGNSYYNRKNVFVLTGNWNLPFGRGQQFAGNVPGWVNQMIGGFMLNGSWTWESGLPFTPSYQLCSNDQDIDGQGGSLCRPSWAGGGESFRMKAGSFDPQTQSVRYFNPVPLLATPGQVSGPFQRPQPGTFGNIQRDSFWGPGLINVDASVSKNFNLPKNTIFQLTAQAFNVFNHPNLGGPSNCIDCGSSSGTINGIVASQNGSSMRILQFAGKLQF